jgi:hypothetical protein
MKGRRGEIDIAKPIKPQAEKTPVTVLEEEEEEEALTGPEGYSTTAPALAPEVSQVFLPIELGAQEAIRTASQEADQDVDALSVQLVYEPAIVGVAEVSFVDRKRDFDERVEKLLLASVTEDLKGVDWDEAEWLPVSFRDLRQDPERVEANQGPFFAPVPERANTARELKSIGTDLADWLYYNSRLPIAVHPELDIAQEPGESERAFKIRVKQAARERRDAEVDALEEKYAIRIDKLEDKLRKKERELDSDEADHQTRKQEELLGAGETVFSMLGGRRRSLSRVASRRRMTRKARLELEETREEIADLEEDITELETELSEDVAEITQEWENATDQVTTQELKPRRTDVDVQVLALAWVPSWLISYKKGGRTRTTFAPAYSQAEFS